jgi:hypothetical protein
VAWYPGKPAWGREDDDVRREQREEGEELGDEMKDMGTCAFDVGRKLQGVIRFVWCC